MRVRIRFARRSRTATRRRRNQRIALGVAALLTPAAAIAAALGLWRIAADLNWANRFAIPSGIFSHWQVWLGAAAGAAVLLAPSEPLRQRRGTRRLVKAETVLIF